MAKVFSNILRRVKTFLLIIEKLVCESPDLFEQSMQHDFLVF